jgi:hypothetical protein
LSCDAVDWAAEASPWPACLTLFTASCAEDALGTLLTAEVKFDHAL